MTLPQTRKEWLMNKRLLGDICRPVEESEAVENNANWLLERLYVPIVRSGYRVAKPKLLQQLGIAPEVLDEAINWGDLSAQVEQHGEHFVISLEEASPSSCPLLCEYIRYWLMAWGWRDIEVRTEW